MFDFVSIIFDKQIEIELLKIQLFSFKFVDENIINNIYILFNDEKEKNSIFKEKYNNEIINYVPINLRTKISIIYIR